MRIGVGRAALSLQLLRDLVGAGGVHDDRDAAVAAEAPEELDAVHVGHGAVEDEHVRGLGDQVRQGFKRVVKRFDGEALRLKSHPERAEQAALVIDEGDAWHCRLLTKANQNRSQGMRRD